MLLMYLNMVKLYFVWKNSRQDNSKKKGYNLLQL